MGDKRAPVEDFPHGSLFVSGVMRSFIFDIHVNKVKSHCGLTFKAFSYVLEQYLWRSRHDRPEGKTFSH